MSGAEEQGTPKTRTIKVDYLARVEGEGALDLRLDGDRVELAQFRIFEPPRFFEAFLRGRGYQEPVDITARICGICPVAYQMSAAHALESILGIRVEGQLRALRRLLYCGEWIESHGLHLLMLHAPDFLGFPDGIEMAQRYPDEVKRGLAIKKVGNSIVSRVGGREIHPINVRVGGFYRTPQRRELSGLRAELERILPLAREQVAWVAGFEFPQLERDYEFVALRHPDEYPFNEGRLVSNKGLDIAVADYDAHFREEHVQHSNALQSRIVGRGAYLCGPLARYALNFDRLSPGAQEAARAAGLGPVVRNPFQSIVVRAVELLYAVEEAIRIIDAYEEPPAPCVEAPLRAGVGYGCTEAPRGILYHRYAIDDEGTITDAQIVPPTSQNQPSIEEDLREVVTAYFAGTLHPTLGEEAPQPPAEEEVQEGEEPDYDALRHACEVTIRNYDPCISCATHFLKLKVERA